MSSEITSTSLGLITTGLSFTIIEIVSPFSIFSISYISSNFIFSAIGVNSFPNFGPKLLKLGFTFFTNIPDELLISSISFTFTSDLISSEICSNCNFSFLLE